MSRLTFATAVLLLALFAAASVEALRAANPCGLPATNEKCGPKRVCCTLGSPVRTAGCIRLPRANPCTCEKDKKPVCCRTYVGKAAATTTETNACFCGCLGGTVLFKNACLSPPGRGFCPFDENPVCCYVAKFDLTYTAGNSCFCGESGGRITQKKFCHLK